MDQIGADNVTNFGENPRENIISFAGWKMSSAKEQEYIIARNTPALISVATSFSSVADKEAIAIALRYLPKGESYSSAKGNLGRSAIVREIPVMVHIAVAFLSFACSILMFPFVVGWHGARGRQVGLWHGAAGVSSAALSV